MQSVITAAEAKKITKGRTPLVPVEYEKAVQALVECRTFDETKYWDNYADALAAWAKIAHSDKLTREARALKLWAYRRMGELAAELRPRKSLGKGGGSGVRPGPQLLLIENGLSEAEAAAARRLAFLTETQVKELSERKHPPAPTDRRNIPTALPQFARDQSFSNHPKWQELLEALNRLSKRTSEVSAAELGASIPRGEKIRLRVTSLIDWLDEFEQALPKSE